MSRRDLRPLLVIAALATLFAATQSVDGLGVGWLMMAPGLLLMVPLLSGRFPGEKTLQRWSSARRPRSRRPVLSVSLPRAPHRTTARGVLLAARAAGRAPPARPLTA